MTLPECQQRILDAQTQRALGIGYFLTDASGEREWFNADPAPRDHKAGDLNAVVEFAKRMDTNDSIQPVVWYSRRGVCCLVNDKERRDRVTLPLELSSQMLLLQTLADKRPSKKQAEFLRLLRIDLAGCLRQCDALIDVLRKVKFTVGSQGESEVRHTKASIGKSIQAELTGTDVIPETVTLEPLIFASGFPKLRIAVACAIEVDPQTETFQLIPLAGEIESAIQQAEEFIGDSLAEDLEDVPAYYGVP